VNGIEPSADLVAMRVEQTATLATHHDPEPIALREARATALVDPDTLGWLGGTGRVEPHPRSELAPTTGTASESAGSSDQNRGIEFAPDSPLEEAGFELSVPPV
jgi:hypothetical protein